MSIKDDVESLRYEANNNYSMYASTKIASQGPLPPNKKRKKKKESFSNSSSWKNIPTSKQAP